VRLWEPTPWYVDAQQESGHEGGGAKVSRVANTYWADERIRSQRVLPRANSSLAAVQQISHEIIGTPADVRRRGGIIPSWVVFGMILLAISAVCVTVNTRTHAKLTLASQEFSALRSDVDAAREMNESLKAEIERLRSDPRTIETAARTRLNMVRNNELVIPVH
jgi:cell division protein FtsB